MRHSRKKRFDPPPGNLPAKGRIGAPPNDAVRKARWAIAATFFASGVVFSNWVTRIPAIQRRLDLSESELGLALLCLGVGALLAMMASGWILTRINSHRVIAFAATGLCLTLPLPALAWNLGTLAAGLFLFGAFNGALDIAVNAQGVHVEARYGKPILSSLHGLWSAGGLFGAAAGGLAAAHGVSPLHHFLAIMAVALTLKAFMFPRLLPVGRHPGEAASPFVKPPRALLGLGCIAFCVFLAEGAIADWSALYLRDSLGAGPGAAAAGYGVFSFFMAAGRLTGDRIIERSNPARLVRASALIAAGGLAAALLAGKAQEPLAIAGFACVGIGLACIFPIVIGRAAQAPRIPPTLGIAAVATAGYTGFLLGPPVIGFAAELFTLRIALGLVVVLCLLVAIVAQAAVRASPSATP